MTNPAPPHPSYISKQVIQGRYLFVDLLTTSNSSLAIVGAGREECASNYQINRAGFSYFAVEYISSGRWELSSGNKTWELGPGSVFAYSPETSYQLRPLDKHHLIKFFVDFKGVDARQKIEEANLDWGVPAQLLNTRWIHDIFDQILALSSSPKHFAISAGKLLTELMFMRIKEDRLNAKGEKSQSHVTYMRCRRFILKNYASIVKIEEVARSCHIDPTYLSRLFKKFAEESPSQLVTRLKMTRAAEILLTQNTTVKDTAAQVSYDDPYHFSRVFKSHHGLSPKHFVKEVQRGSSKGT